jgi:hypothetical protein
MSPPPASGSREAARSDRTSGGASSGSSSVHGGNGGSAGGSSSSSNIGGNARNGNGSNEYVNGHDGKTQKQRQTFEDNGDKDDDYDGGTSWTKVLILLGVVAVAGSTFFR